jgi:hypothetical protein
MLGRHPGGNTMEKIIHGEKSPTKRSVTASLANAFGAMEVAVRQRPMLSLGVMAGCVAAVGVLSAGAIAAGRRYAPLHGLADQARSWRRRLKR